VDSIGYEPQEYFEVVFSGATGGATFDASTDGDTERSIARVIILEDYQVRDTGFGGRWRGDATLISPLLVVRRRGHSLRSKPNVGAYPTLRLIFGLEELAPVPHPPLLGRGLAEVAPRTRFRTKPLTLTPFHPWYCCVRQARTIRDRAIELFGLNGDRTKLRIRTWREQMVDAVSQRPKHAAARENKTAHGHNGARTARQQ
jgi:hypothetical protein